MNVTIYYDGHCPFCSNYVRYIRLKEASATPRLVDVRQDGNSLRSLQQSGYDLDKGMVAEIEGRRYAGADAMQVLALLTSRSNVLGTINHWLFSNRYVAIAFYPILRMCRNIVLLLLHRTPLTPDKDTSLLTLLSACFGMFAFFHFLVYQFDFFAAPYFTTYLIPFLGVWLLFHPQSRLTLLLLLGTMVIDAWWHMPVFSNHTIIKNFLLLAITGGGIYHALRGQPWALALDEVAPVGRALLLTMYIFGVFHKINSGFLNPEVSCANTLWNAMPAPLNMLDSTWFGYATIYGTLIIESLILVFLLIPALRHVGIVAGIGFHMLLALSGYALYAAFSVLSMVLHLLFLTPASASRIVASPLWLRAITLPKTASGKLLILMYGLILILSAYSANFPVVSIMWFAVAIPLLWLIVRHGRDTNDQRVLNIFLSSRWWLNLISLAFFINCVTPYLGLKTAQSINMFANLRLEGGASNHLILRNAPGPFKYLEDLVAIKEVRGSRYLTYIRDNSLYLTYYDLLNQIERTPGTVASYERNGTFYENQTVATLRSQIEEVLHPRWVRKWFHFMPIDLTEPKVCARDR